VKSSTFAGIKPKKKCCRSKPRCTRCPVVLHKVRKAELSGLRGKDLVKVSNAHESPDDLGEPRRTVKTFVDVWRYPS
jgi:hypothetical protein